jgi:hypothetical protein
MYSITVEAPGFAKTTLSQQRLIVASNLRLDVTLQVGAITESITVDTAAAQINVEDAQLGRSLTDIPSLPLLSTNGGRNALSLVGLQPGVTLTPATAAQGPGPAVGDFEVNGQRSQANNFILDGADSNDLAINIADAVNVISPNALGEFRVVTGAMTTASRYTIPIPSARLLSMKRWRRSIAAISPLPSRRTTPLRPAWDLVA